jgi:hypothetical protein
MTSEDSFESHREKWDVFLGEEWPRFLGEYRVAHSKVDEMHQAIKLMREDTKHLTKLDAISTTLREMKDGLIEVVSGKNVIDTNTAKEMLTAQQDTYVKLIATICKVFGVIILVLIGLKFFLPEWFGAK